MSTSIETRCFIAGEFCQPTGGESFVLKNPTTGEEVCEVPCAGKMEIERAVEAAKAAQPAWAALPAAARAKCLLKLADLIEQHADKIAYLDAVTVGKPVGPQKHELSIAANRIRYEASLAESLVGESSLLTPGQIGLVLREPYGVVAGERFQFLERKLGVLTCGGTGILPWNCSALSPAQRPLTRTRVFRFAGKVAPAVAAGNAIIIKSSEKSPLGTFVIAGLTLEAGFPPGVVQVVTGLGATGALLAEHPEIRKISFTGSTSTGRKVAEAAARSNLKAVALELGGKSPTIIFEDADLDIAVPASSFSVAYNSGQLCMANSRIYVHESIAAEFMTRFKEAFGAFKQGDPLNKETQMGPQADEIQGRIVRNYLTSGKQDGKVEMGGEPVEGKGQFIQPTVFSSVPEEARINKEEIFGPVVVVHTFKDEAEAIRRANDTDYGLYASLFTRDIDRAIRVAKALQAGTVGVNTSSPSTAHELPFGGYKLSGVGREGGVDSLYTWTEAKSVIIKYKTTA
ncbi:SPOSA6832_02827 [Sporobolomyces salmonicolor]|uniref:SPOSA6832_02827-mRNA-1:cds n=1 Tax=Sporidiobolus salmonicolor TaxID=5005 RepID=A0A0D6EMC4_SPOSA|nr:SPOSA6832_02827 [Sporobolomyces salmonicolor]